MTNFYTLIRFLFFITICLGTQAYGQNDTAKTLPPPPPSQPMQPNAGFDVIIKRSGEIVYGLVTEVAPYWVYYKRTDIPDGPIYSLPRNEVYAISYRNQVKDYLSPVDNNTAQMPGGGAAGTIGAGDISAYPRIDYNRNFLQKGAVHLGIGFIRSFSKVENANNYSPAGGMPVITLAYDASFNTNRNYDRNNPYSISRTNNLKVGVLIGFGSHKFSNEDYSAYDSTINNISLKENMFGLYAYGKYSLLSNTSRIQPYLTLGLGIATSRITSENRIRFVNDDSKTLLVKSGARGVGLNIMARAGAAYYFSDQLQAFIDAGSGLSLLNLGVSFAVD